MIQFPQRATTVVCVIVLLPLAACLSPGPRGGGHDAPDAAPGWFFLNATASPQGAVSVFRWIPPNGSSSPADESGHRGLLFDYTVVVAPGSNESLQEWAYFIFDRFDDGADAGKARPQNMFTSPAATRATGLVAPTLSRMPLFPGHVRADIRNRSGFDQREVFFVVAARATHTMPFGVAFNVLRGQAYGYDGPPSALPTSMPTDEDRSRALEPLRVSRGFSLAEYAEYSAPALAVSEQSDNVIVDRATGSGLGPTAANRVHVTTRFDSASGWTLSHLDLSGFDQAESYRLTTQYRNRSMESSGPVLVASGGPRGLEAPTHFVYLDGDGPSTFDLDVTFGETPRSHRIQLTKFDLADRLQDLLGVPAYERWNVKSRIL